MPNIILSNESDAPLLMFLWKWKISTTALLSRKWYPARTPRRAYYRLLDLERSGYIQSRFDPRDRRHVWTLGKRGFNLIVGLLPNLKEAGYKSEHPGHDLLVSAVQLGDCLLDSQGIDFCTEQELRRFQINDYPPWVPASDLHRPDGYWQIQSEDGPKTIALEVELNEKGEFDYQKPSQFYDYFSKIHRVIWLTESTSIANRILSKLKKDSPETGKHSFFLINDFFKNGWGCKVTVGADPGTSLSVLLGYCTGISPVLIPVQYHLNVRKSPHIAKTSLFYRPGDFSY